MENDRLAVDALITHRFGFHQMAEAIALQLKAERSLKIVIAPSLTKT